MITTLQVTRDNTRAVPYRSSSDHGSKLTPLFLSQAPYSQVIFKEYATATVGRKFMSLFPGLGYAAGYKVLQRVYK